MRSRLNKMPITSAKSPIVLLAPDATGRNDRQTGFFSAGPYDARAALMEFVSLTGKFFLNQLTLGNCTGGDTMTVQLVIDDEEIYNDTFVMIGTSVRFCGGTDDGMAFVVERNLSLKVKTTTDSAISAYGHWEPMK